MLAAEEQAGGRIIVTGLPVMGLEPGAQRAALARSRLYPLTLPVGALNERVAEAPLGLTVPARRPVTPGPPADETLGAAAVSRRRRDAPAAAPSAHLRYARGHEPSQTTGQRMKRSRPAL